MQGGAQLQKGFLDNWAPSKPPMLPNKAHVQSISSEKGLIQKNPWMTCRNWTIFILGELCFQIPIGVRHYLILPQGLWDLRTGRSLPVWHSGGGSTRTGTSRFVFAWRGQCFFQFTQCETTFINESTHCIRTMFLRKLFLRDTEWILKRFLRMTGAWLWIQYGAHQYAIRTSPSIVFHS